MRGGIVAYLYQSKDERTRKVNPGDLRGKRISFEPQGKESP